VAGWICSKNAPGQTPREIGGSNGEGVIASGKGRSGVGRNSPQ
jgi:hypothetical protein